MYNSNNSNTTVNIISPRTDSASTRRMNQNYYNPNQQKPLNNLQPAAVQPYGYISLTQSSYGDFNAASRRELQASHVEELKSRLVTRLGFVDSGTNDPARTITERIKSYDKYYNSLPPKYKSALKKSKYNGLDVQIDTPRECHMKPSINNKKIKFEAENDVCFTVDKEFYVNNNLKNTVWWSAQELLFIRNIVMTEAVRIQRNNPNLKIGQCIKEICKNS
jgi:hypothetical protein